MPTVRVRLVAAGLILLCLGMFLYGLKRGAYKAARDGAGYAVGDRHDNRVLWKDRADQMRREFAARIPAGERIRLIEPATFGSYWAMMLTEYAAMNGVRLAEPASLGVAVAEDGTGPFGVRLVVEQLG